MFEKNSLGTLDSLNTVVLSHKVQFVKFHNHANIKQRTPTKLILCEKGLKVPCCHNLPLQFIESDPHLGPKRTNYIPPTNETIIPQSEIPMFFTSFTLTVQYTSRSKVNLRKVQCGSTSKGDKVSLFVCCCFLKKQLMYKFVKCISTGK